jgi:hypothetical protein
MQAWGNGVAMPPNKFCGAQYSLCGALMHIFLNHNKLLQSLEDTLQETGKILQPSKPMQPN